MKFLYKLDEVSTQIPWYRPNSINLNKSLNEIINLPQKKYFNVYLAGGFWSNDTSNTWDVDLFVQLKSDLDEKYLKNLRTFMIKCTEIGFNNRILFDMLYIPVEIKDDYYNHPIILASFYKDSLKIINDDIKINYHKVLGINYFKYEHGCYFNKLNRKGINPKIQKYIKNGRKYYKPIMIEDYYKYI